MASKGAGIWTHIGLALRSQSHYQRARQAGLSLLSQEAPEKGQVLLPQKRTYLVRGPDQINFAVVKNPPASARDPGDAGAIPGLGRSPGGGNGNPPQYSRLENSTGRGAWWATVHGVAKSQTRLSDSTHSSPHLASPACPGPSLSLFFNFNF